jgi:hypothetical protein
MSIFKKILILFFPNWVMVDGKTVWTTINHNGSAYRMNTSFKIMYSSIRDEYKLDIAGYKPELYHTIKKEMIGRMDDIKSSGSQLKAFTENY